MAKYFLVEQQDVALLDEHSRMSASQADLFPFEGRTEKPRLFMATCVDGEFCVSADDGGLMIGITPFETTLFDGMTIWCEVMNFTKHGNPNKLFTAGNLILMALEEILDRQGLSILCLKDTLQNMGIELTENGGKVTINNYKKPMITPSQVTESNFFKFFDQDLGNYGGAFEFNGYSMWPNDKKPLNELAEYEQVCLLPISQSGCENPLIVTISIKQAVQMLHEADDFDTGVFSEM